MARLPDWLVIMQWLPDLKVGTIELRDIASLIVGTVGLILAGFAIALGRRQTRIAESQEQIAKFHQKILQETLAQRSDLSLRFTHIENSLPAKWKLSISNAGNKGVASCYWNVYVPVTYGQFVQGYSVTLNQMSPNAERFWIDGQEWIAFNGLHTAPIYADYTTGCGSIVVDLGIHAKPLEWPIPIRWSVHSEDGRYPNKGHNAFELSKPDNLSRRIGKPN